jgi:hypothetical protein
MLRPAPRPPAPRPFDVEEPLLVTEADYLFAVAARALPAAAQPAPGCLDAEALAAALWAGAADEAAHRAVRREVARSMLLRSLVSMDPGMLQQVADPESAHRRRLMEIMAWFAPFGENGAASAFQVEACRISQVGFRALLSFVRGHGGFRSVLEELAKDEEYDTAELVVAAGKHMQHHLKEAQLRAERLTTRIDARRRLRCKMADVPGGGLPCGQHTLSIQQAQCC